MTLSHVCILVVHTFIVTLRRMIPYLPIIALWAYRKKHFSGSMLGHERYFGPRRMHGHKMLSFGQSSSTYLKTEIPQMLAIIHLQDQRYWYLYNISIHAETKHYMYTHANQSGWPEARQKHQGW